MKRWIAFGVLVLLAAVGVAGAQQGSSTQSSQSTTPAATAATDHAAKPSTHKAVRHVVVGKVTAISDTSLTIERTVKGKTETVELSLTKPLSGIAVGDEVRVSYKTEGGKNVVVSAKKVGAKKAAPSTR